MNKTILTIILAAMWSCSALAEGADEVIVGQWKYKAGVLDFRADGSVDASYDKATYRKWTKTDVANTYYLTGPGWKQTLIVNKDGKRFDLLEKKRTYIRVVEGEKPKVKKKSSYRFFSRITWDKVDEVRKYLEEQPDLINAEERNGVTVLHRAKSKEMAELLFSHEADVNAVNNSTNTPLHYAYTNAAVALFLMENGADPYIKNSYGNTPLSKAVSAGSLDVAEVILANGGTPLSEKEWRRLLYSTKVKEMRLLLAKHRALLKAAQKKEKDDAAAVVAAEDLANKPPPMKLEETLVAKETAKFKILDTEVLDKTTLLRGQTRRKKSLLSEGDWDRLPTAISVTFELDIEKADPGKVSTLMMQKVYVKVGRNKYPYIGHKVSSGRFYQGPGITFHSDLTGSFSSPKKPKVTMYFLVPEGTPGFHLIFNDKVVGQRRL